MPRFRRSVLCCVPTREAHVGKNSLARRFLRGYRTAEMAGAHEHLERAEHTAHSGGHGGEKQGSSKLIGLTMALIGVMIAFCAALVGSERNELTRTMIEQTQAHSDYSAASTKFRLIMLELEKQRGAAASATDATKSVVQRFLRLYTDYSKERAYAKSWADGYKPLVDAHFDAAEGYERAQLIAEIGIVLASLAVLIASRPAWYLSLILAAISVSQVVRTHFHAHHVVSVNSTHVAHLEESYAELRKAHVGANEDERTVEALDPGAKLRGGAAEAATGPAEHH